MSETRKLQKIGGDTLYVSLPKRWTSRMQVKKGDRVTLILQPDDSIHIYPTAREERPREIMLEINSKDPRQSLRRGVTAAYVDGFDVIKLKVKERLTEEQHDSIREIIGTLFGLEIIEVTGNTVTIQCLLTRTLPIEKTIQRIHNVVLSMFAETVSALGKQDVNRVRGVGRRMSDIKRLSLVTNRLLRSVILFPRSALQMEVNLIDCVDYLRILHIISEIAYNISKISESVITLVEGRWSKSILEPLFQACTHIQELYDRSIQALISNDIMLANLVLDSETTLGNLWEIYIEADEKSEISSLALSHAYILVDNLKQIRQYSVEIAEIAIDRAEAIPTTRAASNP
jgi:phosphate uptake regulator